MVNCKILPDGDLLVTASNVDRAFLAGQLSNPHFGYWCILAELFTPYSCNGSFTPFDPGDANPFVGLTSAPCVAESIHLEEDGTQTIEGRLWWFPDYMIRDPLDELKARGRTIFSAAETDG